MSLDLIESKEQRRSIIQLMLAGRKYILTAEELGAAGMRETHETMKEWCVEGTAPTPTQLDALYASAHLASAATRFVTVDEILCEKLDQARPDFKEANKYLRHKPKPGSAVIPLDSKRNLWMHLLLRDGIGHYETTKAGASGKEHRWKERGDYLYSLSISEMLLAIKCVEAEIMAHLATPALRLSIPYPK